MGKWISTAWIPYLRDIGEIESYSDGLREICVGPTDDAEKARYGIRMGKRVTSTRFFGA